MTIKKKPLVIAIAIILALIAIAITLFLVFGKERVNVKIVELPKEVGEFKLGGWTKPEFIENSQRMDKLFCGHYLIGEDKNNCKSGALDELKQQSRVLSQFDERFFDEKFVLLLQTHSQYNGLLTSIPQIRKKNSYISKENKLIIQVEITNEPLFNPRDSWFANPETTDPLNPHGFLIEIPRKQFEKYNMTYDDIEIVYLNSHDTRYNVQYGGDKYRLDPNYPQPIGFDYSKLKD